MPENNAQNPMLPTEEKTASVPCGTDEMETERKQLVQDVTDGIVHRADRAMLVSVAVCMLSVAFLVCYFARY